MQLIKQMTNRMANVRIEHLTPNEHRKLKKLLLGYGNLRKNIDKINASGFSMHRLTLFNVSKSGYGHPDTIKIIRDILLYDTNLQNENQ
jgi:hypothetical protein